MMVLVRFIDLVVEFVKLLGGAPGHRNPIARTIAWLVVLALVVVVVGLIAWGVSKIPELIDILNGA